MSCQAFDELLSPLHELRSILEAEQVALKSLDFAGIETAAAAKDALAERLAGSTASAVDLQPQQREALAALRTDVGALAKANHLRLRATLQTVQGVVGAMTGGPSNTYGKNAQVGHTAAKAVLTAEMG